MPNAVLWAPRDSISLDSLRAVARRVDAGIAALREMIGGPWPWQRIGTRAIDYYLVPTRVISHASGKGAVFISIWRVHQVGSPRSCMKGCTSCWSHSPVHAVGVHRFADKRRVTDEQPLWFLEGFPDHLAQLGAAKAGIVEGDIFGVGGSDRVDRACADRLKASPHRQAITEAVGRPGRMQMLFTTQRTEVAPIFYPCSRSLVRHLVGVTGLASAVALMPAIQRGDFQRRSNAPRGDRSRSCAGVAGGAGARRGRWNSAVAAGA
ncbi:MAG: hypothetical protein IPK33_12865 [Gemmatimonadetes bacterium]|nr:hypothetical protein [Gemmatimonadota bacterium]